MEGGVFSLPFTSSPGLKKSLQHLIFSAGVCSNYCFPFLQEKLYLTTIFLLVSPGGCLFSHPSCEIDDVLHLFYSLLFQKKEGAAFSHVVCLCILWVKLNTLRMATEMPIWMAEVDTCLLFQQLWSSTYVPVSMKNETLFNSILNFYQYKRNAVYNTKGGNNRKMGNRRGSPLPKYIYCDLFVQV